MESILNRKLRPLPILLSGTVLRLNKVASAYMNDHMSDLSASSGKIINICRNLKPENRFSIFLGRLIL